MKYLGMYRYKKHLLEPRKAYLTFNVKSALHNKIIELSEFDSITYCIRTSKMHSMQVSTSMHNLIWFQDDEIFELTPEEVLRHIVAEKL